MALHPLASGDDPQTYPAGLEPQTFTVLQLDDGPVEVPTAQIGFKRGRQDMVFDTFGSKGVVLFEDQPMFAELAIQRVCVRAGWEARWLETYGAPVMRPKLYVDWDPALRRSEQTSGWFEEDAPVLSVLDAIARERKTYAGCPDVITWTRPSS